MALGLEIAKPSAVAAMFRSFRARAIGQALAMALLALVCIGYSLSAEMQLMSRGRSDAIAECTDQGEAAKQARETRDRLRNELDKLLATRTTAELEPLIRSARALAKDCSRIETATQREACGKLPALESEAARAGRVADLTERLSVAGNELTAVGTSKAADPGAHALASYLAVFGVTARPDHLGDWIVLIGVLALEIGSALSLSLIGAMSGPARDSSANDVPATVTPPATEVPPSAKPESIAIAKLRAIAKGDRIEATQEEIGAALGTSKTTAHRVLRDLASAGALRLSTTRKGTVF